MDGGSALKATLVVVLAIASGGLWSAHNTVAAESVSAVRSNGVFHTGQCIDHFAIAHGIDSVGAMVRFSHHFQSNQMNDTIVELTKMCDGFLQNDLGNCVLYGMKVRVMTHFVGECANNGNCNATALCKDTGKHPQACLNLAREVGQCAQLIEAQKKHPEVSERQIALCFLSLACEGDSNHISNEISLRLDEAANIPVPQHHRHEVASQRLFINQDDEPKQEDPKPKPQSPTPTSPTSPTPTTPTSPPPTPTNTPTKDPTATQSPTNSPTNGDSNLDWKGFASSLGESVLWPSVPSFSHGSADFMLWKEITTDPPSDPPTRLPWNSGIGVPHSIGDKNGRYLSGSAWYTHPIFCGSRDRTNRDWARDGLCPQIRAKCQADCSGDSMTPNQSDREFMAGRTGITSPTVGSPSSHIGTPTGIPSHTGTQQDPNTNQDTGMAFP